MKSKFYLLPILASMALNAFSVAYASDSDEQEASSLEELSPQSGGKLDFLKLKEMTLEELTHINISSASKFEEDAWTVPTAVTVITAQEIRRSGASSIPELFKTVPGLQAFRMDSSNWAVSSRGAVNQFADNLLVMIDGRTIFSPFISGVFWDVQDVLMEDIDRIEIIRGPGGTLWGSNAVNGVINIISKSANASIGNYTSVSLGNLDLFNAEARSGISTEDGAYRLYAKQSNHKSTETPAGIDRNDDWSNSLAGFRYDTKNDSNKYTVSGDAYYQRSGQDILRAHLGSSVITPDPDEQKMTGFNLNSKWTKQAEENGIFTIHSYLDYTNRRDVWGYDVLIADLSAQHSIHLNENDQFMWGFGTRYVTDSYEFDPEFYYLPKNKTQNISNIAFNNRYSIIPEELFFTAGAKVEHTDYNGFNFQPSAKLSWSVNTDNVLWTSVSRSVRGPDRITDGIRLISGVEPLDPENPSAGDVYYLSTGSPNAENDFLDAYEIGYRVVPTKGLTLDFSGYYFDYSNQASTYLDDLFVDTNGNSIIPIIYTNGGSRQIYGGEAFSRLSATDDWNLAFGYSYAYQRTVDDGSGELLLPFSAPRHKLSLQSKYNINDDLQLDTTLIWNSGYIADNTLTSANIAPYLACNARLGWNIDINFSLDLIGKNLCSEGRQEFAAPLFTQDAEIPRIIMLKGTARF